jgi:hypothetical protein
MRNRSWMVAIGSLILIAGLAAIGYLIFQAGVAQGAEVGVEAFEFAHPMYGPRPFLMGLLGFILVIFLVKFVMRMFFFPFFAFGMGRRHWRHRHPGMYGKWHEDKDLPPFFKDWHDRAHDPKAEEATESEEN